MIEPNVSKHPAHVYCHDKYGSGLRRYYLDENNKEIPYAHFVCKLVKPVEYAAVLDRLDGVGRGKCRHVHHIDQNPMNDSSWNLMPLTAYEHIREHGRLPKSPEHKKKMSEGLKLYWADDEAKAKQSVSQKIAQNRPEVIKKKAESLRNSWQDPEVRARKIADCNRPEVKARRSASVLEIPCTDEFIEAFSETIGMTKYFRKKYLQERGFIQ